MRYPGLGIGGYCLTKDPAFAPAGARQLFGCDIAFPFSRLAGQTADEMPLHTVRRLTGLIGGDVAGKRILLCGIAYREDVADTRYSPAESVYRELVSRGARVDVHDPFVTFWEEVQCPVMQELPSPEVYAAVLFATPHTVYRQLDLRSWMSSSRATVALDAFMVFSRRQRQAFREAGLHVESVGVGDGL
jgi:UDP-N-acetyl-D-glucosamine dehydrogenase